MKGSVLQILNALRLWILPNKVEFFFLVTWILFLRFQIHQKFSEGWAHKRAKKQLYSLMFPHGRNNSYISYNNLICSVAWRSVFPWPRRHCGPIFRICICSVLICKSSAASSFRIRIVTGFDYRNLKIRIDWLAYLLTRIRSQVSRNIPGSCYLCYVRTQSSR